MIIFMMPNPWLIQSDIKINPRRLTFVSRFFRVSLFMA